MQYFAVIHCTSFIRNAYQDIHCSTKTKSLCCFQRPNTTFLIHWIQHYLRKYTISYFPWRFITQMSYAKYQNCKPQFSATSVVLFYDLVTISEMCNCSQTLCTGWAKIPVQLKKKCRKWAMPKNQSLYLVYVTSFTHSEPALSQLSRPAVLFIHSFTDTTTRRWCYFGSVNRKFLFRLYFINTLP